MSEPANAPHRIPPPTSHLPIFPEPHHRRQQPIVRTICIPLTLPSLPGSVVECHIEVLASVPVAGEAVER